MIRRLGEPHNCLVCKAEFPDWHAAARHVRSRHRPTLSRVTFVDELLWCPDRPPPEPEEPVRTSGALGDYEEVWRGCCWCGWIVVSDQKRMYEHLVWEHHVNGRQVTRGQDWVGPEIAGQWFESRMRRFERRLTIVDTVGDFLLECRIFRPAPGDHL